MHWGPCQLLKALQTQQQQVLVLLLLLVPAAAGKQQHVQSMAD
jgi:hypothetical protein